MLSLCEEQERGYGLRTGGVISLLRGKGVCDGLLVGRY